MKSEQFFSQEVPTEAWHHTKALMRLNLSGVEETLSPICLCFKARTQPRFTTHTKKDFSSLKNANSLFNIRHIIIIITIVIIIILRQPNEAYQAKQFLQSPFSSYLGAFSLPH